MKVQRLPVDPGPAGWNVILPPAPPRPVLTDAITADFLVIGAGFAGLSAARRLTRAAPGARIVVLDARRVAEGPAGRNSGFMVDLPHNLASKDYGGALDADRMTIRLNRMAIDFAEDAAREYDMSAEAFDRRGKMNAAATEKGMHHNADFARHLAALDEPFAEYDAQKMREITGTDYYLGGLYAPGAAIIQPALYIRGLADGIAAAGVEIFENSPVISLTGGDAWTAETPEGQVKAEKVILAVNGHAESFGKFTGRLMHIFTYASMTRELSPTEIATLGGQPVWECTPSDPLGTSVRRISGISGDRILVRNRFTFDPDMEVSDRRIARVARDHDRAFAARFPMLKGVEMIHRWGGRLCLSRNDVPAFGMLEPGLYSACCQNGIGTVKGTLSGIMAAELATGVKSDGLQAMLAYDAPVRLPPRPFSTIGANAYIRWGELRAGREL